jgi:hypothetical protein
MKEHDLMNAAPFGLVVLVTAGPPYESHTIYNAPPLESTELG